MSLKRISHSRSRQRKTRRPWLEQIRPDLTRRCRSPWPRYGVAAPCRSPATSRHRALSRDQSALASTEPVRQSLL
jgi:hypothetical protein